MTVQSRIEARLTGEFKPVHLEVVNESGNHNVPPGSESHFRLVVVSRHFEGVRLLARHRQVNKVLADELAGPVHALAIHALTPDEWELRETPKSPPCLGGGSGPP